MLSSYVVFITVLLQIFMSSVSAQNEETCISNYAELKQALFQEGTGNMERLLYTFTPPNLPVPHFIWVYYFYNKSSEWSDILTCPPSSVLDRCPVVNEDSDFDEGSSNSTSENDNQYHVLYWSDSPMLVNIDIPLLRVLSYNSILQYLGDGSCVQIVLPPFCESVDPVSQRKMLNFATTYLRSYSISSEESDRDYVLNCEEKFEIEYAYDGFLLLSQIIICVGSSLLVIFLSLKICSIRYYKAEDKTENNKEREHRSSRSGSFVVIEEPTEETDTHTIEEICQSCKKGSCIQVDATFDRHRTYFSVVLIISVAAISLLVTDAVHFSQSNKLINDAFWYGYGAFNVILLVIAYFAVVIEIPVFTIYFIVFGIVKFFPNDFCCRRTLQQHKVCLAYNLIVSTLLNLISFIYILSRSFFIALAFASYPLQVGFILLAIGSGFIALFFVMWAAVHISVESYQAKSKLLSTIISLIPYGSLLIILFGFLLSYIFVILQLNIRLGDPVTSLVVALIPTVVGFVAANSYKSELTKIRKGTSSNDRTHSQSDVERGQSMTAKQSSSANIRSPTVPSDDIPLKTLPEVGEADV